MAITQLNLPIPVITPKGSGECWFLLDYGKEDHLMWIVALDESGEIWTLPNTDVRAIENYSVGRKLNNGRKRTSNSKNNRPLKKT